MTLRAGPSEKLAAEILAAGLAARILHDISGPASGVASGLDLLAESGGSDAELALDLAASSARTLLELLEFHKAAFGGARDAMAASTLRRLALAPFEARRPRLEWGSTLDPVPGLAVSAALILVQIAATALAAGGVARASLSAHRDGIVVRIEGEGPRATLLPETLEGLEGRELSGGLAGRWAPCRYLNALVTGSGGSLRATVESGRFILTAALPAATVDAEG